MLLFIAGLLQWWHSYSLTDSYITHSAKAHKIQLLFSVYFWSFFLLACQQDTSYICLRYLIHSEMLFHDIDQIKSFFLLILLSHRLRFHILAQNRKNQRLSQSLRLFYRVICSSSYFSSTYWTYWIYWIYCLQYRRIRGFP